MDKTVLKNFAIESRKDLIEKIDRKIKLFYVDEEFKKDSRGDVIVLSNDKHTLTLTKKEDSNRDKLVKRIIELGYNQVVEEASYTWFNRIIAIRYMEIHDYLPLTKENQSLGIRVLSSNENTPNPEILKFSNLSRNDLDINFDYSVYSSKKNDDEKFKYVLLLICKKLGNVIPQVFDGITDYIDLLIPDNMLSENGFIHNLLSSVDEDNFKEVEIIGWLYQYYNQEEKDKAIGFKKEYNKNEIPFVTQLFTPDWIVKYLVENSLGRLWVENNKSELSESWNYFISNNIEKKEQMINVNELTFIDPCCGSGHILVYAFELLYQMYIEQGYNKKDIPRLILENNIYGLDIDERAAQLSILSIILKAREYDKNIFSYDILSKINICSIPETTDNDYLLIEYIDSEQKRNIVKKLIDTFKNGKELGSLIKVDKMDLTEVEELFNNNKNLFDYEISLKIKPLIKAYKILMKKYKVVATNPPYMSSNGMTKCLKEYVELNYNYGKNDLFSSFILKCMEYSEEDGYIAMITMQVWMFIATYENFRNYLLNNYKILSMLQIGFNTFPELNSKIALGTAFVLEKGVDKNYEGIFYNLNVSNTSADKEKVFMDKKKNKDYYISQNSKYFNIAGVPIAYWVSDTIFEVFKNNKSIADYAAPKQGMATGMNERFLRLWFEIPHEKIGFNLKSSEEALATKKKWFPYNKGGDFRKWYGNTDYVVNWENDGYEIKHLLNDKGKVRSRAQNVEYYFKKGITWSFVNLIFGCRIVNDGFLFDVGGSSVFPTEDMQKYMLGYLNSNLVQEFLKILNPSLVFQVGNIASLPFKIDYNQKSQIELLVSENVDLAKREWDFYETSYDFKKSPLLLNKEYIKESICLHKEEINYMFNKVKENEEKLNKLFFNIYGIKDFDYKVDDKYISIRKIDEKRIVEDFISYFVGCLFGRYSLETEGIVYDGGIFDINRYKSFVPDDDNIIPISEDDNVYYNDDIVGKFKQFIKIVFGDKTINENLDYIAEVLEKKGTETSEERIRRYFLDEFYLYHCNKYSVTGSGKRPIYWLFDSGKKNGFKCLIYLHRYNEQLVSKIRTKYLHNTLSVYQRTVEEIDYKLNNTELSTSDKRNLQTKKSDLNCKITECNEYDEMIGNVANKMIKLDLDDGVLNNYAKFVDDNGKSILAKIK